MEAKQAVRSKTNFIYYEVYSEYPRIKRLQNQLRNSHRKMEMSMKISFELQLASLIIRVIC